jgi:sigma-B regulation protein RsbU (phosphoserine phosphatase)
MGLFENANYEEATVTLADGDILVLYTDGITEAIDADEEEFGEARLEDLVLQNASCPAQQLTELIIETATAFATEAVAVDDETLVVIKRQSSIG